MNAEFQRRARRDKKASSVISAKKKRKTIEWGSHAKMGSIKNRNGMDLTEAEDIRIHRRTVQKRSSQPR